MTWEEICADPSLRDLPPRSRHGEYQIEIGALLRQMLRDGRGTGDCPIQTSAGVRVPDVAWVSSERRQPLIYTLAPEICVEIIFPSNDEEEMSEKRALYFEAGALEVWICAEDGAMSFYNPAGLLAGGSAFCPEFPAQIDI